MQYTGYLYIRNLFYVQALRVRPDLQQRPFWIDLKGKVLACSPTLEPLGIRQGTPARQARRIAPDAERVEYREEDYRAVHDLFCDIAYRFTPVVEPFRPGEIFLGLQEVQGGRRLEDVARALLAEVRDLGFEGTVAVSGSRLVSRLLGRMNQPGCVSLHPSDHVEFLANRPVECLWTAPSRLRQRLNRLGIFKIADLQRLRKQALTSRFGKDGLLLYEAARGRDLQPVQALWPPEAFQVEKRVEALQDREVVFQALQEMSARLSTDLKGENRRCRRLKLEILEQDRCLPLSRQMTIGPAASGANRLYLAARRLFEMVNPGKPLECLTLTAEHLTAAPAHQLDLFSPLKSLENGREEFKAFLTLRFGSGTLKFGSELASGWRERMLVFYRPDVAGLSRFH